MTCGWDRFGARGRFAREKGFTFVELCVVVVVISILAAIGVAVYMKQRARGYEAQAHATLQHASIVIQSWVTEHEGDYRGLDDKTGAELRSEGFRPTAGVTVDVEASSKAYCVTADHSGLDSDWKYSSAAGHPQEGACTGADG
jgi:prepilin-type N-terminal cleavage/methylation domain-containing protein